MIVDAFILDCELDMVELRLHELRDVVDIHVVVESRTNFAGHEKPLWLTDRALGLYLPEFAHKLYVFSYDFPPPSVNLDPYGREFLHRQHLIPAVFESLGRPTGEDDVIFVSDADEIPRPSAVVEACELVRAPHRPYAAALDLRFFETWMDCVLREHCPSVIAYEGSAFTCDRNLSADKSDQQTKLPPPLPTIPDGGWHFSGYGGPSRLYMKHTSYGCPSPFDHPEVDPKLIGELAGGRWSYVDRANGGRRLKLTTLERHPNYVRQNLERWTPFMYKAGRV